jgi:Fe-S cluster assembly protein SufD
MNTGLPAEARERYAAGFARALAEHGEDPAWLNSARRAAFDSFVEQGWPSTKQEDWRFTDTSPVTRLALLPPPDVAQVEPSRRFDKGLTQLGVGQGSRGVFLDGRYRPELSSDTGLGRVTVAPLSSALAEGEPIVAQLLGQHLRDQNAFLALNTAFMTDGVLVRVPAGHVEEQPIYVVYLASKDGVSSFPRTLIWAGEGSRATVVEIHVGADDVATLSNAATEIALQPGARLAYHTIQAPAQTGFHVGHVGVTQKADSVLVAHALSLGGRLIRNDLSILLAEEGAACTLDGLYLASGTSHIDNHTSIDHRKPRTTSREDYRGAVDGKSRAVFSGRIVVRPDAQQTDARQSNRNLLLSEGAKVHSKPHLEIFANDVKCSHGATTGRLDQEALFYLRSRGIGEKEASRLLVRAFLFAGLERVADLPLRNELEQVLASRIDSLQATTEAA